MPVNKNMIVITGCDSGIGEALAKVFSEKGYKVVISYFMENKFTEDQNVTAYKMDLKNDEAGRLSIENDRDGFAVRALLKRASEALNVTIMIKKVNKQILFWKE